MLLTIASDITVGQAGIYALLGYGIVFFGLILLMLVITLVSKFFISKAKVTAPVQESTPAPAQEPKTAPGTAGQLKLYDVEPKTAAMLMAIVADKLGKPINELRFISIREVQK
jgi:Na+-transporting methylmalonyl-CoA/oxaloacetate decarboxylase gamma subunit